MMRGPTRPGTVIDADELVLVGEELDPLPVLEAEGPALAPLTKLPGPVGLLAVLDVVAVAGKAVATAAYKSVDAYV